MPSIYDKGVGLECEGRGGGGGGVEEGWGGGQTLCRTDL